MTVTAVAMTPTNNETRAPYMILTSRSRPWESVPSQNVLLGPTGWPAGVRPMVGNCVMLPCPVIAANTGAPIAQATITTTKPRQIIDARSRRSRRTASTHGLLPSIAFCGSPAAGSTSSTGGASVASASLPEMLKVMTSPTASSATGDQAGLDHTILFCDQGGGQRDVLAVCHRIVTGGEMTGGVAQLDVKLRLRADALWPGLRAPRVEGAAGRRVDRRRHVARQDDALPLQRVLRVGQRHRGQQRVGVRM